MEGLGRDPQTVLSFESLQPAYGKEAPGPMPFGAVPLLSSLSCVRAPHTRQLLVMTQEVAAGKDLQGRCNISTEQPLLGQGIQVHLSLGTTLGEESKGFWISSHV